MWRSLTSRSSSSSFNTGFSYSTIAVDPTAGGRSDSPDFYSANANCMFASFGLPVNILSQNPNKTETLWFLGR
ncbi:hypothetical protein SLEP1_g53541 [Rubroshorea leprosula]|uniref:Uncharacterized protein n=1 Tax=Rubroshorea leprosula TaxID=152421 RepID=A0AAV5M9P6_9ROSI|nr:hypothetical protein SLEP1_g53541 [Rubroshorea leprosula]